MAERKETSIQTAPAQNFRLPGAALQTAPAQTFFERIAPYAAALLRSTGTMRRVPFLGAPDVAGRMFLGGGGELAAQLLDRLSGEGFNQAVLATPPDASREEIADAGQKGQALNVPAILKGALGTLPTGLSIGIGQRQNPEKYLGWPPADPVLDFFAQYLPVLSNNPVIRELALIKDAVHDVYGEPSGWSRAFPQVPKK